MMRCYKVILFFTSEPCLFNQNIRGDLMKKLIYTPSLLFIFSITTPAQSADKIIDRYKKAIGGDAVKKIKSTSSIATLKTSEGQSGRYSEQSTVPDRLRADIEIGKLTASECYNGKSAWRLDAAGLRTLL